VPTTLVSQEVTPQTSFVEVTKTEGGATKILPTTQEPPLKFNKELKPDYGSDQETSKPTPLMIQTSHDDDDDVKSVQTEIIIPSKKNAFQKQRA
jgi:hypothetical protein